MLHDGLATRSKNMAATEVELQELDQIAADLTKGCLSSSDDKIIMERCDFTPKNKSIEGQEVQDMNEYVMSYFESLNSMSRRIIAEHRQVIEENKEKWCNLSPEQQDRLIDDKIVDPKIRKKYGENRFDSKPEWFPVLKLAHGLSDSDRLNNPRDSIASVTFQELHSRDQFSSPWSWSSRSQEDLRILDEGELEENIKKVTEQEERAICNPLPQFKVRKKFPLVDSSESKNSSRTASTQGSDPLTRKEFLDIDGEQATSKDSSIHSSKGSLGSSDGSEPSSSKRREEERLMKDDLYNGDSHDDRQDEQALLPTTTTTGFAFLTNW